MNFFFSFLAFDWWTLCCAKIRSFSEDSCAILISFKSVVIFADFVLIRIEKYHNFERNEDCATVF